MATTTDIQGERLAAILERGRATPHYRGLSALTAGSLADVPVTEKAVVRARPEAFRPLPIDAAAHVFATSATTGPAMTVLRTRAEQRLNVGAVAEAWRSLMPAGSVRTVSLLDHSAAAAGVLVEQVFAEIGGPFGRAFPYAASGPRWDEAAAMIAACRANVLIATPGELIDGEAALRAAGRFADVAASVETVLLLGEPSTAAGRARLARSWGAEFVNASYGSTETTTVATGCARGGLHVLEGRFALELRTSAGITPLGLGRSGELIVTPLHTEGIVLLRYATGDTVHVEPCACGRQALRVAGRQDDLVLGPDGGPMGPEEIEAIVYASTAVQDYLVEVDAANRVLRLRVLPFPGQGPAALDGLASAPVEIVLVSSVPASARAGGVVKSWRRTRVIRERRAPEGLR